MIHCKELNRDFGTKLEMHLALKAKESDIIRMKKVECKSGEKGQALPQMYIKMEDAEKSGFSMLDGCFYPVINTTNFMDGHSDVHFPGIWNRSLKNNGEHYYYVHNHNLDAANVIAWPEDVKAFTKTIDWAFIGLPYEGKTQALIFEVPVDKVQNDVAKRIISDRRSVQNSVRMQYVKVTFGCNSDHKDLAEAKAYFDAKINDIANKEAVLEQGYFYGIEEAKIVHEGSMVLFGSNQATPIRQKNDEIPDLEEVTIDTESVTTTQKTSIYGLINSISKQKTQ